MMSERHWSGLDAEWQGFSLHDHAASVDECLIQFLRHREVVRLVGER